MRIAFCCSQDINLGAGYVIAYLKSEGHRVELFFDPIEPEIPFINRLVDYNPDLVCFSCVTANKGWALQRAKTIKSKLDKRLLFGGVHPTLCPEDFEDEGFDVCVGDGIKYFGGRFEPDRLWADREIFFEQLPPVHRAYQIFMTGFGCPFHCSFCNNHQLHRKLIRRTVSGCMKELIHLKKNGMRYVLFDDDIFVLNKDWLIDFLTRYRTAVDLPYTCFGHVKFIDNEIASLLKQSGCQCVWIGIQSGHEPTRKQILNRQETNKEITEACRIIKKHKLKLMIDHIFGLPFDNEEKLWTSYSFYKTLKPDVLNCYELLVFPKAEIGKYGATTALYQKQGGEDYKRYAKSFAALALANN